MAERNGKKRKHYYLAKYIKEEFCRPTYFRPINEADIFRPVNNMGHILDQLYISCFY